MNLWHQYHMKLQIKFKGYRMVRLCVKFGAISSAILNYYIGHKVTAPLISSGTNIIHSFGIVAIHITVKLIWE